MRKLLVLLCLVVLCGMLMPQSANAATSFKIGNTTVTADCVSHTTAVKTANTDLTCNNLAVGEGKHQCCWGYTAAVYKKIWGESFNYRNSDQKNNLLRNLEASERKCTAENLERFFAQTKPGAVLRIDTKSNPTDSDGSSGHTMLFLELGSDGGYFYEGNYSQGKTRIIYHTWENIESKYGKKDGKDRYIKYIYWKGAPTFNQGFTTADSKTRIAVSTKTKTGNPDDDQCYIKDTPFENGKTVDVIAKGSVIHVVGAVKNKHGNTWYKTKDGNYVWSGDVTVWEYSDLFSLSANFKNRKDQNSHAAPYADSDKIKAYPAGKSFKVKAFVTNSHGNIWAELADGGYMNFYDKGADLLNMDFVSHVTQPTHDTSYPTGDIKVTSSFGFRLEGKVKAQVPFLTLTTRIVDRKTEKDVTAAGSPMSVKPGSSIQTIDLYSTKIDGKTVDSQTMFRKLTGSSAWYRYELNAQFGFTYAGKTFKFGSEMNLVSSNFTVGNPGTLEENPTPEVKGKLTIGSAVKNGNVLEVPVGIQGNPGLVGVSVEIGLPEEFKSFNAASAGVGASAMVYTDGLSGGKMVALMSTSTISGDGGLFRLYLPLEDLGLTEFTLKVNCVSAGDADGKDILLSSAEKVIKLSSGRIPGDANDDGSVGWPDLILMLKHVSGWSVSINMTNADVTADDSVGWNDLILLLKHVSGWNVELK